MMKDNIPNIQSISGQMASLSEFFFNKRVNSYIRCSDEYLITLFIHSTNTNVPIKSRVPCQLDTEHSGEKNRIPDFMKLPGWETNIK